METVEVVATQPYPICGASQFLTIVHCGRSERPPDDRLFLSWEELSSTVLAGAFCPNTTVILQTPLPPPYNRITLPPLTKNKLRPEEVRDNDGKVLGMLLRVPGLFVQANQILSNYLKGNVLYDYRRSVANMVKESGRLLASEIKSGILGIRSHPGIMAHALERREMAADEIGISEQFAEQVLKKVQDMIPLQFGSVWDLDGFPVYAVRFPVANRYAVQGQQTKLEDDNPAEMYLRILPGAGKYIACNPFNLCKLWLGDRDGDQLFALLRWEEVDNHTLEIAKRPRIKLATEITIAESCVTLQNLLNPCKIKCEQKLQDKMLPTKLDTFELRRQYVADADTRTHVATYTMVFGWWLPRVLTVSGKYPPQEAYQLGNDLLEIFIEWCMDARKGGSPLSDPSFDAHKFMRLLRFGKRRSEDIDFFQLEKMGVPKNLVDMLNEAWTISDGNLPAYCSRSPFYKGLVLGRNTQEQSIPSMLLDARKAGVSAGSLYMDIINDLTARRPVLVDTTD